MLLCLTVLHVINGLPLESDEGIGNSIDEGEILSVSTIINGIRREEIPDLLEQIAKVRTTIKTQAFDTLMTEVAYNGVSLEHTKTIIDVVKVNAHHLTLVLQRYCYARKYNLITESPR